MQIRIVTWNMAYWSHKSLLDEAWNYMLNEIDADFYLFQEARPPKTVENDTKHLVWNDIGGNRPWGSGIYSKKYELHEETIETTFKGVLTVANSTVNEQVLTLISLYGLMESSGPTKGFAITNLHRMLSDLTGLFWGRINGKRNIILGGDLNASMQIDDIQSGESHKIFFDRLKDFGLSDSFELTSKTYPTQTLRHLKSKKNWQNDYFFISNVLNKKLVKCEIIDNERVRKYSDHNPVIITLDV